MAFEQDGRDLHELGYPIIPLTKGTKACHLKGWPDVRINPANIKNTLERWMGDKRYEGWGILTTVVPAIDLDILDVEIVDALFDYIQTLFPEDQKNILRRIGRAPKLLIPCRYRFDDDPFRKMSSRAFTDLEGHKHQVEILARGQYFAAYGIHPETGKEYEWPDRDLMEVLPEDLPELTVEIAEQIIEKFESMVPAGWTEIDGSGDTKHKTSNRVSREWFESRPADVSTERLREYLHLISPEDHTLWVKIGFALYHQYRGADEGFDLWCNWSARSIKYKEAEMEGRWRSMNVLPKNQEPVTARFIIKLGAEAGGAHADGPLLDALDRYVLVTSATATGLPGVADKRLPANVDPMTMKSFETRLANISVGVPKPNAKTKDELILKPLALVWLQHPDRDTVDGVVYAPGLGRYINRNEQTLLNQFHKPIAAASYDKAQLAPFFKLMNHLFPDETERDWFIKWMAFTYKHPEERPHVTPLHIAPDTGTGRGTLVVILQKLLGRWNVKRTNMADMMKGAYNEYLDRSTLVIVDEIGSGGHKYDAMAVLNEVLTESDTNVNRKFGAKGTVDIYCNFLFLSNERDAISLPINDRRMNVFVSDNGRLPVSFYEELRQWCGYTDRHTTTPGIEHLRTYLNAVDLRDFDRARPIENLARRALMHSNMPPLEADFIEWKSSARHPAVMTTPQIRSALSEFSGIDDFDIPSRQMAAIIRKYLLKVDTRVKVDGAKHTVWFTAPGEEVKTLTKRYVKHGVAALRQFVLDQKFNADGSKNELYMGAAETDD